MLAGKYILNQLEAQKGKIVWLASYPKSGNTWFRCFFTALLYGKVDLNNLSSTGVFSARSFYNKVNDFDSHLFTEAEMKNIISKSINFYASRLKKLTFIKTHYAYTHASNRKPVFPAEVSHKIIYFVRNPLDVVASFASHNGLTIDKAITVMNDNKATLAIQKNGLNIKSQIPQLLMSWSGHLNSWLNQKNIEVQLIRYEDMLNAPFKTFNIIMKAVNINVKRADVKKAIQLTKFSKLQLIEKREGFNELAKSSTFFRKGKMNGWKTELTKEQIRLIIEKHRDNMTRLGYKIPQL